MRKLKLPLEALSVESFVVMEPGDRTGTVHGRGEQCTDRVGTGVSCTDLCGCSP